MNMAAKSAGWNAPNWAQSNRRCMSHRSSRQAKSDPSRRKCIKHRVPKEEDVCKRKHKPTLWLFSVFIVLLFGARFAPCQEVGVHKAQETCQRVVLPCTLAWVAFFMTTENSICEALRNRPQQTARLPTSWRTESGTQQKAKQSKLFQRPVSMRGNIIALQKDIVTTLRITQNPSTRCDLASVPLISGTWEASISKQEDAISV